MTLYLRQIWKDERLSYTSFNRRLANGIIAEIVLLLLLLLLLVVVVVGGGGGGGAAAAAAVVVVVMDSGKSGAANRHITAQSAIQGL